MSAAVAKVAFHTLKVCFAVFQRDNHIDHRRSDGFGPAITKNVFRSAVIFDNQPRLIDHDDGVECRRHHRFKAGRGGSCDFGVALCDAIQLEQNDGEDHERHDERHGQRRYAHQGEPNLGPASV